jgi:hypothetical protein
MNFNDHTIIWDNDTIPMKDRGTLSSTEALIEVYMSANEPQTFRDEYTKSKKILDTGYVQRFTTLDDVIKT